MWNQNLSSRTRVSLNLLSCSINSLNCKNEKSRSRGRFQTRRWTKSMLAICEKKKTSREKFGKQGRRSTSDQNLSTKKSKISTILKWSMKTMSGASQNASTIIWEWESRERTEGRSNTSGNKERKRGDYSNPTSIGPGPNRQGLVLRTYLIDWASPQPNIAWRQ